MWRQRKSPYITSFCPGRCNLHGACGGKVFSLNHSSVKTALQSARSVWRQSSLYQTNTTAGVLLQSARSVWRQSCPAPYDCMALDVAICTERVEAKACNVDPIAHANRCNLHGACGGKGRGASSAPWSAFRCNLHGACGGKVLSCYSDLAPHKLQSARSVWRQSVSGCAKGSCYPVAICTERVEAKMTDTFADSANAELQSARSVWRQSKNANWLASAKAVAICTERVEAKYVV